MIRRESMLRVAATALLGALACGRIAGDLADQHSRPGAREDAGEPAKADAGGDSGGTASGGTNAGGVATGSSGGSAAERGSGGLVGAGGAAGGSGGRAGGSGGTTGNGGSSDGTGGSTGGTGGVTAPDGGFGSGGVPGIPDDVFTGPTVWIGQAEFAVTYPTVIAENAQSPEKVVLVLDAIMGTTVTGTITFGEGPRPTPENLSTLFPSALGDNWNFSPAPAYPYSLVASELKGNRLAIFFAPSQVLTPCPSGVDECISSHANLRKVDLVITDETMTGEINRPPGNWLGSVPAIRLKRHE